MKLHKCTRIDGKKKGEGSRVGETYKGYWDWQKGIISSAPVALKARNKQNPVFPGKFIMPQKKPHLSALPATNYENKTSENIRSDYFN